MFTAIKVEDRTRLDIESIDSFIPSINSIYPRTVSPIHPIKRSLSDKSLLFLLNNYLTKMFRLPRLTNRVLKIIA